VQWRILILAGGGSNTGYACVLTKVLHEKLPVSFLVPEADFLSERKSHKFGS